MLQKISLAALNALFSSVNERVNGFEHHLTRRSKEFRCGPSRLIWDSANGPMNVGSRARKQALWDRRQATKKARAAATRAALDHMRKLAEGV